MLKPENFLGTVAVVPVQVGEGYNVNDLVITEDVPQLLFQVTALVLVILRIMHIGEVEENPTSIGQLYQAGISVADGEEPNDMHTISLRMDGHSTGTRPVFHR